VSRTDLATAKIDGHVPRMEPGESVGVLITAQQVGQMLMCSARTVRRLQAQGAMPRPLKLGALVRWRREDIDRWICEGCPRRR